jgi:uncharacterized protein (TIGR02147 family)
MIAGRNILRLNRFMIFNYESLETYLKDELRRRVRLNPRYSLRSFARNLKLSPGALSEILRGQRNLSVKSVAQVARAIGLNAAEAKHLLHLAQLAKDSELKELETQTKARDEVALSEELFSLISEWYHFAILNLLECEDFEWNSAWISRRLGISRIQTQMAMELLLKMGLVERKNGRYAGKSSTVLTNSEIPSGAIRSYHRQILEKAILALEGQTIAERDISGSGFAFDPAHLPAVKKEISEFQDKLVAKYRRGNKTEVYFLEMALFKLTHGSSK